MIDIGGRRFRIVRAGARGASPLIVFEAGSFGASPDWAVVQDALGAEVRTFAYDRAGLGYSDPGPRPRDSRAIAADLAKLLAASGEAPPYILVAHSMAAVHAYVFALTRPAEVVGMVLIDALAPAALAARGASALVRTYQRLMSAAPMLSRLKLAAVASPFAGDGIDLPEPAKTEKRRFFASSEHNRWAALEVKEWLASAALARGLGDLDRELPVATVGAGRWGGARGKRLQAEPAHRSRSGYAVNIAAANHASILGPKHAEAVVKAIDFVRSADRARRPPSQGGGI